MKIVGHDFLVRFADGIELEVTGPRRANQALTEGHARSIAIDYLERTGRIPASIVSSHRLPPDQDRHGLRVAEARKSMPRMRLSEAAQGLRASKVGQIATVARESVLEAATR